jgi:hypothetical protein
MRTRRRMIQEWMQETWLQEEEEREGAWFQEEEEREGAGVADEEDSEEEDDSEEVPLWMTQPQAKKAALTLEQAWLRRKERRWQRALAHVRRAWACRPALQRSPSKIREALSLCFGEDLAAQIELQGAAVTLTRRAKTQVAFLSKGPTCDERAIGIVTEQCQCSRIRAISALKRNGGDAVDAIMWLFVID